MQIYRKVRISGTSTLNIYVVNNSTKMLCKFTAKITHSARNFYKTKFNNNFYVISTVLTIIFYSKLNVELLKDVRVS